MEFFILSGLEDYAGYVGVTDADEDAVASNDPPLSTHWSEPQLTEYFWGKSNKPRRTGEYHSSGSAHFFSSKAIALLGGELRSAGLLLPVRIAGREQEGFHRYWVTKQIDCLDLRNSEIDTRSKRPGSIGLIRKARFRLDRWDGSNIFSVPGDPNANCFVSARFVDACAMGNIAGAQFERYSFDPNPIVVRDKNGR